MTATTGVGARYETIVDAQLETPQVLRVRFEDGSEAAFPVAALPFSTSKTAVDVRVIADGDGVEIQTSTEDFDVTADELRGLLDDSLGSGQSVAVAVGARLRAVRKELGLSLRDAEALTQIAVPNLSNLEAGASLPRLDTLMRLAAAYHVPVTRFVIDRDP